jgi:hypothetical protein
MTVKTVTELAIIEELHSVPQSRWNDILAFIRTLRDGVDQQNQSKKQMTAADLSNSDLVGMWAGRTDIGNSRDFARQLREKAQTRSRSV